MLEARPGAFIFIGNGDSAGLHHPAYDFNDDAFPPGSRSGRGSSKPRCRNNYWRASRCPSKTAGWQAWPAEASPAQSRAAMLAFGRGPAISRSSMAPGFCPSRTAITGRRPSNSAGWPDFSVIQSERRPSIEALPPISTPNSVRVATELVGPVPVTRCPAAHATDWSGVGGFACAGAPRRQRRRRDARDRHLGQLCGRAAGGIDPVTSSRLRSSTVSRAARRSRSALRVRTASASRRRSPSWSEGRLASWAPWRCAKLPPAPAGSRCGGSRVPSARPKTLQSQRQSRG